MSTDKEKEIECLRNSDSISVIGLESIMDLDEKGIIALRFIYKGDYYDQNKVCSRDCLVPLRAPDTYIESYSNTNRLLFTSLVAYVLCMFILGCVI